MASKEHAISVLEDIASLLKKTQINLRKCPKQRLTRGYVESRIKCLEEYWAKFQEAHDKLIKCTTREQRGELPYFVNEEFFIQEDLYLCMMGDLKDILNECTSTNSHASNIQNSSHNEVNTQVRLPPIQIPIFHGNYEDWPTFKDLFTCLVHDNTTLSEVQKLHYLKTTISGEPASLLKNVQVTNANYNQAWNTLCHRYGNKRLIVNALLKRLFGQKKCTSQSASQLKALLDTTTEILNSLRNLNVTTDSWDPIIIFLVVQKLDPESHKEWEEAAYKIKSEDLSTLDDLTKFLESKFRTLELVAPSTSTKIVKERALHVSLQKSCIVCKGAHNLSHCNDFNKMQVSERANERSDFVKKNKLCFNCLATGHAVFKCKVPVSCHICKRRHHTLLHQDIVKDRSTTTVECKQPTSSTQAGEEVKQVQTMTASYYNAEHTALLATAVVIVKNEQGHTTLAKALIDSGSQACFISERMTQILKLERTPVNIIVSGMESMKVPVKHEVRFHVMSRWESKFNLPVRAYVMSKRLTTNLPSTVQTMNNWQHLKNINLADSNFNESGNIDLLLGVDEYAAILQQGLIKGPPGTPCAQKTSLGWIVMGGINMKINKQERSLTATIQEVDIEELLKSIWEIDTDTKRKQTQKERLCEEIYEQTHKRNTKGRYIVKLPFNTEEPKSTEGNTREIALRRFIQLERKLNKNTEFRNDYRKVIEDYKELGHIEEVPEKEIKNKSVYLPHHAVIRSEKETTKTRVVFDASCKGDNGVSLNDELLLGPILQDDLRSLLIRWRMHEVCFAADIEKMYRMILVHKTDTDYQRILWRSDSSEPIKDYRLLTVTFGTASAPYLAVKTLMQLAIDEGSDYPEAAKIVTEDFYVDDMMSGCDDLEKAIKLSRDLKELLNRGGFNLKKWSSNNKKFMESISPHERSSNAHVDLKIDGTVKALGIQWNLGNDQFEYSLNLHSIGNMITKRTVLSDIQKLFDPLGWISPCIVLAKILIQKLWQERVNWDEPLNATLTKTWTTIRSDLESVNEIHVDRWLGTSNSDKASIEIHGFSDASIQAYAAVVYCRVKGPDGWRTSLIASKTRVAPLKTISLPRLELCGALLLSRLIRQVGQAMRLPSSQIYAWTDSSIVISWLFGDVGKWKPFVANRVVEITSNVHNSQWYHVFSHDNPADIASRGMLLANLKNCDLWWYGPEWLSAEKIQFTRPNIIPTDIERKKDKIQVLNIVENQGIEKLKEQIEDFETLTELLRTITFCKRFFNFRKLKDTINSSLKTEELEEALKICVKLAQREEFAEEIENLRRKGYVKGSSKIKSLNPHLDEDGIIKVGGRLRNAPLNDDIKHPIILGRQAKLTKLLIADAHQKTMHGGVQLMMTYLSARYWILRAKSLVKQYVHKCLICAKHNAKVRTQVMGDLPAERVTPARPFLNSGVDFAGPFQILMNRGRGAKTSKSYVAIFICMATKATHLELVGDLTTAAFIGAFKRFTSRRGKCANIWSDQGRNFIGANKDLYKAWKEASLQFDKDISDVLANDGTQWHFIPPYSPNFGGLWEAGVKSMKHHLKRILTTHLTFEEMTTVLCEIEACLNSRPLCPLDNDTQNPLTPGHFLIGEAPIVVPSPNLKDQKLHNLERWQYTQKLRNDFWSRWQGEYLSRLQQRPKWLKREEEFKLGDIVLLKQENLPPGKWSLGRIVEKHPGPDGMTRVYSVKSGDSVTRRCVTKLCALPIDTTVT